MKISENTIKEQNKIKSQELLIEIFFEEHLIPLSIINSSLDIFYYYFFLSLTRDFYFNNLLTGSILYDIT